MILSSFNPYRIQEEDRCGGEYQEIGKEDKEDYRCFGRGTATNTVDPLSLEHPYKQRQKLKHNDRRLFYPLTIHAYQAFSSFANTFIT